MSDHDPLARDYAWVPLSVLDDGTLSVAARVTYMLLLGLHREPDGTVRVSCEYLAERLGSSKAAASRGLRALCAAGYLERVQRARPARREPSRYRVKLPETGGET